ncbi:hypothetical protein GHI55_11555 [Glaesserella parasuis]|nr:hypothetical protein [Glaesserella parasuis]
MKLDIKMAFPKHKRTYGAKKATKKLHCRAHKDKKSDLKCFLQRKERSRTVFMEKKKEVQMLFYKYSALALYFRNTKSEYRCLFAKNAIEVQDGNAKNEPGMRRARLPIP